jgi:hypothetical protein
MPRVVYRRRPVRLLHERAAGRPNVTYEVDGGWELQPGGRYYHLLAKAVCNGDGTFTVSGFGRIISSFSVTSGRRGTGSGSSGTARPSA